MIEIGVVFLGYDICPLNGKGLINVAYNSSFKMAEIIEKCLSNFFGAGPPKKPSAKQIKRMKRNLALTWLRLRGWQNYFKICDDFKEHNDWLEALLAENAGFIGIKYEELPGLAKRYFGTRRSIRWNPPS